MSDAALLWIVLYGLAAVLFFATAAVISVVGARDLKDLLSRSHRTK